MTVVVGNSVVGWRRKSFWIIKSFSGSQQHPTQRFSWLEGGQAKKNGTVSNVLISLINGDFDKLRDFRKDI